MRRGRDNLTTPKAHRNSDLRIGVLNRIIFVRCFVATAGMTALALAPIALTAIRGIQYRVLTGLLSVADGGLAVLYNLPAMLAIALPFGTTIGTVAALRSLHTSGQSIALSAGGVSAWGMLLPVMASAAVSTSLFLNVGYILLPRGESAWQRLDTSERVVHAISELPHNVAVSTSSLRLWRTDDDLIFIRKMKGDELQVARTKSETDHERLLLNNVEVWCVWCKGSRVTKVLVADSYVTALDVNTPVDLTSARAVTALGGLMLTISIWAFAMSWRVRRRGRPPWVIVSVSTFAALGAHLWIETLPYEEWLLTFHLAMEGTLAATGLAYVGYITRKTG